MKLIGRKREIALLERFRESKEPEFVAVYGRRRVGKTYLICEFFNEEFAFSVTALNSSSKTEQLGNFHTALRKYGSKTTCPPTNWYDAFEQLIALMESSRLKGKKIIFLDELPWFDTRRSGFVTALEHFWNGWAARRPDILLIVCGSATSWMIGHLVKNKGGLHNRVTQRLHLAPFTLREAEEYLVYRDILWERIDIATAYMVLGGIPFYLKMLDPRLSCAQNIDSLCFEKDAPLRDEFDILFASLYSDPARHIKVLEALSKNRFGLTRDDLLAASGFNSGGGATTVLRELEQCGFIERYNDFSGKNGRHIYQLTDFFTSFYLKNMRGNRQLDSGYWQKSVGRSRYNNWAGLAFEKLCLAHIEQIKQALGISGMIVTPFAWRSARTSANGRIDSEDASTVSGQDAPRGAQIDLILERSDRAFNICECKFASEEFVIEKDYALNLRNKIAAFRQETRTRKTIFLSMVTTFGIKQNKHSGMVSTEVTLDDLFR